MSYKEYAKYTRKDLIDIIDELQDYAERTIENVNKAREDGMSAYYINGYVMETLRSIANKDREHIQAIVDFKRLVRDEL